MEKAQFYMDTIRFGSKITFKTQLLKWIASKTPRPHPKLLKNYYHEKSRLD